MALTYTEFKPKISIGGRWMTAVTVTLDTEYPTEGYTLNTEKLGLPDGLMHTASCSMAIPAKGATAYEANIVEASAGVWKIQLYQVGEASKPLAEVANKTNVSTLSVLVQAIGR